MSDTEGTTEGTEIALPDMQEGLPVLPGMQVIEIGPTDDLTAILAMLLGGGPPPWRKGQPLPHLDFTDPPGTMSAVDYEATLRGLAGEAPSGDVFTLLLLATLGTDLVEVHKVPDEIALTEVTKFAEQVYAEAHPTAGYVTV